MKLISILTYAFSLFCRKRLRDWLKFFTHIALVILVLFTIASYFGDKQNYIASPLGCAVIRADEANKKHENATILFIITGFNQCEL
ncbi:hypothetical protein AM593_02585, partial [Mytilus galloprovincialis]